MTFLWCVNYDERTDDLTIDVPLEDKEILAFHFFKFRGFTYYKHVQCPRCGTVILL